MGSRPTSTPARGAATTLHLLFAAIGLAACRRGEATSKPPAIDAAVVITASSAPSALATRPGDAGLSARPDAGAARVRALSPEDRRALARALSEGRALARQKKWAAAQAAFERGRAVDPDDARLLSELGWAAFNAGELDVAERVSAHGLAASNDPLLRAQLAYNGGRAAEARGDRAKAVALYADSLRLRPNATVAARLAALTADAGPAAAADSGSCKGPFPSEESLCGCLAKAAAESSPLWASSPRTCEVTHRTSGGELLVVREGVTDAPGDASYMAVAVRKSGLSVVAELGQDFEPGAFGVHNSSTIEGLEERDAGGLRLALLRVERSFVDLNLAGLEELGRVEHHVFVCTLRDPAGDAPRCRVDAVVDVRDYAAYQRLEDGDEMNLEVEQRRKENEHDRHAKLGLTVTPQGKVVVRFVSGDRSLVEPGAVGEHAP